MGLSILSSRRQWTVSSLGWKFFLYLAIYSTFQLNPTGVIGSPNFGNKIRNAIIGATATASSDVIPKACSDVEILNSFVSSSYNEDEHSFYIQGWRWHTLSLVRDAKRLQRLTQRLISLEHSDETGKSALEKAISFVIDFNYRGLKGVEQDVFFPWLRDQFSSTDPVDGAIHSLLQQLDKEKNEISNMAQTMKEHVELVKRDGVGLEKDRLLRLERLAGDWKEKIQNVMELQDEYIVPAIAISVSAKKQQSLNNRVIRKLGLLDSRIHLVGMYDAIISERSTEQPLFKQSIPAIPRYMIPRWKQSHYLPKTDILEETYPL